MSERRIPEEGFAENVSSVASTAPGKTVKLGLSFDEIKNQTGRYQSRPDASSQRSESLLKNHFGREPVQTGPVMSAAMACESSSALFVQTPESLVFPSAPSG